MNVDLLIIVAILVLVVLTLSIFMRLRKISETGSDEYATRINELSTQLALSKQQLEYLAQEKQRLIEELGSITSQNSQLQTQSQTLLNEKIYLTNECTRLGTENHNLRDAYLALESLLNKLRQDIGDQFNQMKERAILELQNRANDSLFTIGRQSVVEPLDKKLRELDERIIELKKETQEIGSKSAGLSEQAHNLTQALIRDSQKKGDFGEMILANILEFAGLKDRVCYLEQQHINTLDYENRNLRPDCIIRLPDARGLVIDSKNIVGEYFRGFNQGENKVKAVTDAVNLAVKDLSSKGYIDAIARSTGWTIFEYVIMFIPNEGVFNLVLEQEAKEDNRGILWTAFAKKVIIAGPSTILPLLAIIEKMWQSHEVEEKVASILKIAYELSDQLRISLERLTVLGNTINRLGTNYDELVKSFANGSASCAVGKLSQLAAYKREISLEQPFLGDNLVKKFPRDSLSHNK